MKHDRLNIIDVANVDTAATGTRKLNRREEARAKFERLWLIEPEQFNPQRNEMERTRMERTLNLIKQFISLEAVEIVDLGCGSGVLAEQLADEAAQVLALDIASNALKVVQAKAIPNIKTTQDYVPNTLLNDNAFDIVISTELIGYLESDQYRLYFSELARVVKPNGNVVCSTAIDIDSIDSLQRFAALAETEFLITKWVFSYHYLYIRLLNFLNAPSNFVRASKESEYRKKEIEKKGAIVRWWFATNSSPLAAFFWTPIQYLLKPLIELFRQSRVILNSLENVSQFIWSDSGISHAIFIGARRPLIEPPAPEKEPVERKHRKEVWE